MIFTWNSYVPRSVKNHIGRSYSPAGTSDVAEARVGRIPAELVPTAYAVVHEHVPRVLLVDINLVDVIQPGTRWSLSSPPHSAGPAEKLRHKPLVAGVPSWRARRQHPHDAVTLTPRVFLIVGIPHRLIFVLRIVGFVQRDLGAVRDVDDGFRNVDAGRMMRSSLAGVPSGLSKLGGSAGNVPNSRRAGGVGQLQLLRVPPNVEQGVCGRNRPLGRPQSLSLPVSPGQGSGVGVRGVRLAVTVTYARRHRQVPGLLRCLPAPSRRRPAASLRPRRRWPGRPPQRRKVAFVSVLMLFFAPYLFPFCRGFGY